MIFPHDQIHDEDAALDWWDKYADESVEFGVSPTAATLLRTVIASLRDIRNTALGATLSLAEAARESGYSAKQVGRWVRSGKLTNVGSATRPRVLRSEIAAHKKATVGLPHRPIVRTVNTARDIARAVAKSNGERR